MLKAEKVLQAAQAALSSGLECYAAEELYQLVFELISLLNQDPPCH